MNLNDLQAMMRLKRELEGKRSVDVSKLESDFLRFSAYCPQRTLEVRPPKLYELSDVESSRLALVLCCNGITATTLPKKVGFSGAFSYEDGETVSFFSTKQFNVDQFSAIRSYIQPLVEAIYSEGYSMLRDFTIHEALTGKVTAKRGNLNLKEVHLFSEQFVRGQYQLQVELDTPLKKTVKTFMDFNSTLESLNDVLKLSDKNLFDSVVKKGIELRKHLGALSRYEVPQTNVFDATTNYCFLRTDETDMFYLYSQKYGKNALVYFGKCPFVKGPPNLITLNGDEHQYALNKLIELDFFVISDAVLKQRITDLQTMYETTMRKTNGQAKENLIDIEDLLNTLKDTDAHFENVRDAEQRKKYLLQLAQEYAEFIVCPQENNPVLHDLLPRLSWNANLRHYSNTSRFMKMFESANEPEKESLVKTALSNIIFSNQQNEDVNRWLYDNHRDVCTNAGVEFKVSEQ